MRSRTLLIFVAIVVVQGCGEKEPMAVTHGGSGGDDHSNEPHEPSGGVGGGVGGSGGTIDMGGSGGSTKQPPLPPNFTLECDGMSTGEANADPVAAWVEERDAHGAIGTVATLALQGTAYRVEGKTHIDMQAPFTLMAGTTGSGIVDFQEAMVDDIEERGQVTIFAGDITAGTPHEVNVVAGSIEGLGIKAITVADGAVEGVVDVVSERLGNYNKLHRASARVEELELTGVSRVSLLPEGTIGNDARVEWMPTGSVVIHDASEIAFHDEDIGAVRMPADAALELEYAQFGIGGDFASGSLEIEGARVQGTPVAVFGRVGALRVDAGSVEATGDLQITQAINEAGLVVPASVEIITEASEVYVPLNGERVVRFFYRERSYTGDAVLGEIHTGGSADELLELQTTSFLEDTLTAQLVGAVIDTGWAAPIAALTAIPAIPIVFVIDVFDCIFGGCLDQPAPLEPFPQWIDAGGMGSMEVRVKGDLGTGTYQTSLIFVGRNYCPVTVPLIVHVGIEPPVQDAGASDAGDASLDGG